MASLKNGEWGGGGEGLAERLLIDLLADAAPQVKIAVAFETLRRPNLALVVYYGTEELACLRQSETRKSRNRAPNHLHERSFGSPVMIEEADVTLFLMSTISTSVRPIGLPPAKENPLYGSE